MRAILLGPTFALLCSVAFANPKVGALVEPVLSSETGCRFSVLGAGPENRYVILEWVGTKATMKIDGKTLALDVSEARCSEDCVSPGKRGVRVIHFLSDKAQATLRKPIFCHKDSEVCSGLPEGTAKLIVSTAQGSTALPVWNQSCDQ